MFASGSATYTFQLAYITMMNKITNIKVYMTQIFFISIFKRSFKMTKNGIYFLVIELLIAELFKILIDAN